MRKLKNKRAWAGSISTRVAPDASFRITCNCGRDITVASITSLLDEFFAIASASSATPNLKTAVGSSSQPAFGFDTWRCDGLFFSIIGHPIALIGIALIGEGDLNLIWR